MHRIDTPTAEKDKFGQGKNGFTNGDPTTGRPATHLDSEMWDAVQEELCTVIEKAQITLDKNQHAQLYQAVKNIAEKEASQAKTALHQQITPLQQWQQSVKAKDLEGESRYTTTMDLTGLSTERYYPVWWVFPDNIGANNWLTLHRNHALDAEKAPFGQGVTHLAGLLVQIEWGDFPWGGDAHYFNIKRVHQSYRKTVKAIRYNMLTVARPVEGKYPLYDGLTSGQLCPSRLHSGAYLRGGLTYFVTSNRPLSIAFSRKDEEVEMYRSVSAGENVHKSKIKAEDPIYIGSEFEIRYMVKSFAADDPALGKEYDDVVLPYAIDYDKRYQPLQK